MKSTTLALDGFSSSEALRISKSLDGATVSITFIEDKSNGYRTFILSVKDFEKLKSTLDIL